MSESTDVSSDRAAYRAVTPSGIRELFVGARTGSDRASGLTPDDRLESITEACQRARPGDRITVAPGSYGYVNAYGLRGTSDAWISIEAEVLADPPVILVDGTTNGIDIQQSSHLGLFGLHVDGARTGPFPDPSGITVFRGSVFVRVWGCVVHDFPGGGINCFWTGAIDFEGNALPAGGWDCVDLRFNRISGCCRRSAYNTSGISFFGAEAMTTESLEGGWGFQAIGNVISDCECLVPYSVENIGHVTDGNGISVDSLQVRNRLTPDLPPYSKPGLIEDNLVVHNGGRGLHIYNSAAITDRFNTFALNLRSRSVAFDHAADVESTWSGSATVAERKSCHLGNVVLPRRGRSAIAGGGVQRLNVILGGPDPDPHDLDLRHEGSTYFEGPHIESPESVERTRFAATNPVHVAGEADAWTLFRRGRPADGSSMRRAGSAVGED